MALLLGKVRDLLDGVAQVGVDVRILAQVDIAPVQQQFAVERFDELVAHVAQADDIAQVTGGDRRVPGVAIHVGGDDVQRHVEAVLQLFAEPAALVAGEVGQAGEHLQGDRFAIILRHRRDDRDGSEERQGENE